MDDGANGISQEGGEQDTLLTYCDAPVEDFLNYKTLEEEVPEISYTWRSVLMGLFRFHILCVFRI